MGLSPVCVHKVTIDINWKLYELNSRLYRGRPKDGSIRPADLPPFLAELLTWHLDTNPRRKCTCRNTEPPWCPGGEYVFLGQRNGHHRRSSYGSRIVRPAADGWYPERQGRYGHPAAPVLVDSSAPWPGVPLSPWPPAIPGEPYAPPVGRGIFRLAGKDGNGCCPVCTRTIQLRHNGTLIKHKIGPERCAGSGGPPCEPISLASWLPLRPGLTPHGLRHGHQTWLRVGCPVRPPVRTDGSRGARHARRLQPYHSADADRTSRRSASAMGGIDTRTRTACEAFAGYCAGCPYC